MDKYDFSIKVEQLKKLAKTGDYGNAMKIADTIDWRRVQDSKLLQVVSEVYENNLEYGEAKEILLLAYERSGLGRRFLYKLVELAIKEGSLEEAEAYYKEFEDIAGNDSRIFLLRYHILSAKRAPVAQRIQALEHFNARELDEKYMYELAELYYDAGMQEECVRACDNIILMFGIGQYVDKALQLKTGKLGFALNDYQRSLLEHREQQEDKLRAVEEEFAGPTGSMEEIEAHLYAREEIIDGFTLEPPNEEEIEDMRELDEEIARHMQALENEAFTEQKENEVPEITEDYPEEEFAAISKDLRILAGEEEWEEEEPVQLPEDEAEELLEGDGEEVEEASEDPAEEEVLPELPKAAEERITISICEDEEEEQEASAEEELEIEEELLSEEESVPVLQPEPEAEVQERATERAEEALEEKAEAKDRLLYLVENDYKLYAEKAMACLKDLHAVSGEKRQIIKIKASKLNEKNLEEIVEKIVGKDLIVEEAGDLNRDKLAYLEKISKEKDVYLVLVDNQLQMGALRNPESAEAAQLLEKEPRRHSETQEIRLPEAGKETEKPLVSAKEPPRDAHYQYEIEELGIDDFARYAEEYATGIDCVIDGKNMLALYERIEIMQEERIPLTRKNAEALITEVADRAEKPPLLKSIKSALTLDKKYDKDDKLILKKEHFNL